MIAEVYPLKRLSRHLRAFDYSVPDELKVSRGNFVKIQYRKETVCGVVRLIKDKPLRGIKLKKIISVFDEITLRNEELSFFESLAFDLAQSVASTLYISLPTPSAKKNKSHKGIVEKGSENLSLSKTDAEQVVRTAGELSKRCCTFAQVPDIRRALAVVLGYLRKRNPQKTVVIAPTKRDVELIKNRIAGRDIFMITGDESNEKRYVAWNSFRSSQDAILIGTRTALLCIDASVSTIFLLRSGDRNLKQYDRNPRYDCRRVAFDLHDRFKTNVFFIDVMPKLSDLNRFSPTERVDWNFTTNFELFDMRSQNACAHRLIPFFTENLLRETLDSNRRVLCVLNQKGVSRVLQCADCSHRFACSKCDTAFVAFAHVVRCPRCKHEEPIPLRCVSCNGNKFVRIGSGNEEIANVLKNLFPDKTVSIIDKEHPSNQTTDITVATSYYFESVHDPFNPDEFSLVVLLDADSPLYSIEPDAVESLTRELWQWLSLSTTTRSKLVVQSWSPKLVGDILLDPTSVLSDELESRRIYNLPPFYQWFRITYRSEEPRKVDVAMSQLCDNMKDFKDVIVMRRKTKTDRAFVVDVGTKTGNDPNLINYFLTLPDRYVIDTGLFD